jgi:MFS transporter, DHA1 family, inner membrane transport protein
VSCAAKPARHASIPLTVLLAACVTVIVAIEFIAAGLLPVMARSMDITIAEAGLFVTAFAVAAGIFGPPLTLWAERLPPRLVLLLALLIFALGNLAAAAVATPIAVLLARLAQGAVLPVFVSVANAEIGAIVGEGRSGRAIAQVNIGLIVGLVVAVPAGVALADGNDWRLPFAVLGLLALLMACLIGAVFPSERASRPHSSGGQIGLLGEAAFLGHLLLSVAVFTAMFTAYTYLAAFLENIAGLDASRIALALVGFGAVGLIGNEFAGRWVDRRPIAATIAAMLLLAAGTALLPVAGGSVHLLLPVLALWGLGHGACFVLCQVRVMAAGARAPAFSSSLNIAASNLGIALGAAGGGTVLDAFGLEAVGPASAVLAVLALALAAAVGRIGSPAARGAS